MTKLPKLTKPKFLRLFEPKFKGGQIGGTPNNLLSRKVVPKTPHRYTKTSRLTVLFNPAGVGGWEKRKKKGATESSLVRRPVRKEGREVKLAGNSLNSL